MYGLRLLIKIKLRQLCIRLGFCKPTVQDGLDRIILSKELWK